MGRKALQDRVNMLEQKLQELRPPSPEERIAQDLFEARVMSGQAPEGFSPTYRPPMEDPSMEMMREVDPNTVPMNTQPVQAHQASDPVGEHRMSPEAAQAYMMHQQLQQQQGAMRQAPGAQAVEAGEPVVELPASVAAHYDALTSGDFAPDIIDAKGSGKKVTEGGISAEVAPEWADKIDNEAQALRLMAGKRVLHRLNNPNVGQLTEDHIESMARLAELGRVDKANRRMVNLLKKGK